MRFTAASIALVIIGAIRRISLPKLKDMPLFIASGSSGVFLYSILFNTGTVTVVAGVSSFIIAASPVFTVILSKIFLKEVVKPACWIGVGISFIGLAAVTLTQAEGFTFSFGIILIMGASIVSSIYSLVIRVLTKSYTALEATTYSIIIGTIGMFVFLPDVIREVPNSNLTVNLLIVVMGIFPSALAYLGWSYALSRVGKIANVAVFAYLIPFVSTLIAYLWLGETFTIYALFGGIVIIIGMIITNIFGKK
jgi:drug/metabolite transporter (DMT)-like permease